MLYFAGSFHFLEERHEVELFDALPVRLVDAVHQIHIDIVGVETFELCLEHLLHVLFVLCEPDRHLVREKDLFAVTIPERFAYEPFALAVVVSECCVDIVYAGIYR